MKILFIAPIPLPINGQSKASKVLLDKLLYDKHDVTIVNLSKSSLKNGFNSLKRVFDIFYILVGVWKKRKNNDIIYLSLAESFFGNLRDLYIYTICYKSRHNIFIHMLGGAGMKKILEGKGVQQKINSFFINKIGGVIVEGPVNFEVFSKVIKEEKIHIVPNFAEDFLFVTDDEIKTKFSDKNSIQILYLSNLIPGKGYDELADAYIELEETSKKQVNIVFVGGFESQESENEFLTKIKTHDGLNYIGKFIDGEKKRELYCQSHVFCLPTYYPFEGQPISILEGYATGCIVITSNHSGIPFIFSDKKNGFIVEKKSIPSIKKAIEDVLGHKNQLEDIAFNNRNEALEKYRTSIYQGAIMRIFNNFSKNKFL
jgi:glycosyltransferase involved in cell wall biosynthesis